jgi:hypothetical protein
MPPRNRARDFLTADMFEVPTAPEPTGGSLDMDLLIRHTLSDMLKQCPKDRYQVAAEISRLVGREVSKNMLDAYTAESRTEYNLPLQYVVAVEAVTESYALTNLISSKRGGKFLVGEEALLAELGRIQREKTALNEKEARLKQFLGRNDR